MSVNLELPTAEGLKKLAPHKSRTTILRPMKQIRNRREENRQELVLYRHAPEFVPAGQSTQMIVGAAGESAVSYTHLDVYKRQAGWNVQF